MNTHLKSKRVWQAVSPRIWVLAWAIAWGVAIGAFQPAFAQGSKNPPQAGKETHGGSRDKLEAESILKDFRATLPKVREKISAWMKTTPLAAQVSLEKIDVLIYGLRRGFIEVDGKLTKVDVSVVFENLYVGSDPEPKDFRNYSPKLKLEIQGKRWWDIKQDLPSLYALIFHELLNLIGLELDDYIYSKDFRRYLETGGSGMEEPNPLERLSASDQITATITNPHYLYGMRFGKVTLTVLKTPRFGLSTLGALVSPQGKTGGCVIRPNSEEMKEKFVPGAKFEIVTSTYRMDTVHGTGKYSNGLSRIGASATFGEQGSYDYSKQFEIHCESSPDWKSSTEGFIGQFRYDHVATALGDSVEFEIKKPARGF